MRRKHVRHGTSKLYLLDVIVDAARHNGACIDSQTRLAEKLAAVLGRERRPYGRMTVLPLIKQLVQDGAIEASTRPGNNKGGIYTVTSVGRYMWRKWQTQKAREAT